MRFLASLFSCCSLTLTILGAIQENVCTVRYKRQFAATLAATCHCTITTMSIIQGFFCKQARKEEDPLP